MLLDNYKKLFMPQQVYATNARGNSDYYPNVDGQTYGYGRYQCIVGSKPVWNAAASMGSTWLDVGTGDTAETASDYTMTDMNKDTGALTVLSMQSLSRSVGDIINLNLVVKNNGNSNVTIREVGIAGNPTSSNATWPAVNYTFLLFRKVLDNPVIIAPDETYNFNYRVRFKSN